MSTPIVVGVDGSESALTAVRWAAEEAARRKAPLKLVHAFLLPTRGYPDMVVTGHEVRQAFEQQGNQWLEEAARTVRDVVPEVETSVVFERPAAALIAESRNARLVVLGSQGLGAVSGLLVGSVAVAVAQHGKCPVVVIHDDVPDAGPVVVGVDGSPASEEAIRFAFEEASLRDATLTALIAWTDLLVENPYATRLRVDRDEIEVQQRELLAERLAGWQQQYPDVSVERVVVRERPVRALLDAARNAQLLVVGSHGLGGFAGMFLGSTSQALVYHSPCPLMVVRSEA
ncbi:nucleotide-binding universal stress UspA family protein [Saccharothrix ecbatanensis]|jgi:nucleotide-binding universal stress UspA family protein|uniref:Nucleotide-binding universal stress UspA family protein n=1 Tax=Saccharothrix ecbatanensis TaxID=1105145 RepID=A0A7W9HKM3_9PSEU|nr:universal stress protein [Saccharothrix ecbatanensis]MBB5803955.1 nucleotide-binding universal stress UspA family protein [Saccharothrix ecbatanensis]